MDKKRGIELLIQAVDEIPHLKTLHYRDGEIKLWLDKVENIIREGLKPEDYNKYWPVSPRIEILKGIYEDNIYQEKYLRKITDYELALKSILLKYEILENEAEPIPIAKENSEQGVMMNKRKALELLKLALDEIPDLREKQYDNQDFELWVSKIKNIIKNGLDEDDYKTFVEGPPRTKLSRDLPSERLNEHYQREITLRETAVKKVIQKYEILGIEAEPALEKPITGDKPKAFIAHGGDSPALAKLKSFLEALGVQPLVVEEQTSEGRSVGENVDWYSRQADCAIVLATKGDIDGKTGSFIPRGNVLMEIGKLQAIFGDRIIYLLQAGTKFPTNISEKVRERFTTQNMDNAFIKIVKELRNWGFIRVEK